MSTKEKQITTSVVKLKKEELEFIRKWLTTPEEDRTGIHTFNELAAAASGLTSNDINLISRYELSPSVHYYNSMFRYPSKKSQRGLPKVLIECNYTITYVNCKLGIFALKKYPSESDIENWKHLSAHSSKLDRVMNKIILSNR